MECPIFVLLSYSDEGCAGESKLLDFAELDFDMKAPFWQHTVSMRRKKERRRNWGKTSTIYFAGKIST